MIGKNKGVINAGRQALRKTFSSSEMIVMLKLLDLQLKLGVVSVGDQGD